MVPPMGTTTTAMDLSHSLSLFPAHALHHLFVTLHHLLSTTTLVLHLQSAILVLVRQTLYASYLLAQYATTLVQRLVERGWKATERARRKIFIEFMIFILGGGQAVFLVLFWPGWIVVAGAVAGAWLVCG